MSVNRGSLEALAEGAAIAPARVGRGCKSHNSSLFSLLLLNNIVRCADSVLKRQRAFAHTHRVSESARRRFGLRRRSKRKSQADPSERSNEGVPIQETTTPTLHRHRQEQQRERLRTLQSRSLDQDRYRWRRNQKDFTLSSSMDDRLQTARFQRRGAATFFLYPGTAAMNVVTSPSFPAMIQNAQCFLIFASRTYTLLSDVQQELLGPVPGSRTRPKYSEYPETTV